MKEKGENTKTESDKRKGRRLMGADPINTKLHVCGKIIIDCLK
jgi:hypothetical protein